MISSQPGSASPGKFALNATASPSAGPSYDQWGETQIPTVGGPLPFAQISSAWVNPSAPSLDDPALSCILDFLATFLATDGNAVAAWKSVGGGVNARPPVTRLFQHDPSDTPVGGIAFSADYCPALFMWREDFVDTWEADDWRRQTTTVKALWVYPPTLQDNQRTRQPFGHVIAKLCDVAIERGRTPSWIQPGDTDSLSATQGTLLYPYAGFESFWFERAKKSQMQIQGVDGVVRGLFPAVEMTFKLLEKLDYGLGRYPVMTQGTLDLYNPQGQLVDEGYLNGNAPSPVINGQTDGIE